MTKKAKIIIGILLIVVVVLIAWLVIGKGGAKTQPRTATAERKDVTQDVSFTGRLAAERLAVLGFESAGTLTSVGADVGDRVYTGQRLASLDTRIAQLDLAKAKATQFSGIAKAEQTWLNAQQASRDTLLANNRTIEKQRQAVRDAKAALDQQKVTFQRVSEENGDESSLTSTSRGLLVSAETAYHAAQKALDEAIKTAEKSNKAATGAEKLARDEYLATVQAAPDTSGSSTLEISAESAAITLSKNAIVAPFDGVITSRKHNPHEYVPPGTEVFTIQTVDSLKVTAEVAETDAMKLAVGQQATITFDAFSTGNDSWTAEITRIAPAAVLIEGVPTYEVTLHVNSVDNKLKPGLTANVVVHAAERKDVIAIPRRSVTSKDSKQYVTILGENNKTSEKVVTTGLVGSDGLIEVTSGLSGGEKIVIDKKADK